VPNFKEKLEAYKREFSQSQSLLVSEETYIELKSKPEEQRSLKEYLQVKIYESLDRYQRELESLRRENDELEEQSLALQHKADRDQREVDAMRKLMKDREEDARRRIDAAERRNRELEVDLNRVSGQYKTLIDRGVTQKEVEARMRELEVQVTALQNNNRTLEDQLAKANDLKHEVEKRAESLRR
jgi:chromosome segregation ATPase